MNIPFWLPITCNEKCCIIKCTYLDFKRYAEVSSETASAENNLNAVDGVYVSLNGAGLGLIVGGIADFENKTKFF